MEQDKKERIVKLAKGIRNRIFIFYFGSIILGTIAFVIMYMKQEIDQNGILIDGSSYIIAMLFISAIEAFISHGRSSITKAFKTGNEVKKTLLLGLGINLLTIVINAIFIFYSLHYANYISAGLFGIIAISPILLILFNIAIVDNQVKYGEEKISLLTKLPNGKSYWHKNTVKYLIFADEDPKVICETILEEKMQKEHNIYMMEM